MESEGAAATSGATVPVTEGTHSVGELREFMETAKRNDVDGLGKCLLERPSLLNAPQGGIGNTALHWAAARDCQQSLLFLLQSGAVTSVQNSSGATALHSAAANGMVAPLEALLRAGADGAAVDEEGRSARDLAEGRIATAREALRKGEAGRSAPWGDKAQEEVVASLTEIIQLLDLQALICSLRADHAGLAGPDLVAGDAAEGKVGGGGGGGALWTMSNLNLLLTLARVDKTGVVTLHPAP